MDAARFFFGTRNPEVEFYDGTSNLSNFLWEYEETKSKEIKEGTRNSTMSALAGKLIKKYGDTDEGFNEFIKQSERCVPPLDDKELEDIWHSAQKFFKEKVEKDPNYVPPEEIKSQTGQTLKPRDYSDVGQAEVLAREYKDVLRYSESTQYIVFNGVYWEEYNPKAQCIAQKLTLRQMMEAERMIDDAKNRLDSTGATNILIATTEKKAESLLSDEQMEILKEYQEAKRYPTMLSKDESQKILLQL